MRFSEYDNCCLCARGCGVNRNNGQIGYCRQSSGIYLSHADLHKWEEPIISGARGSGTIFFSGCSLGCVFCQNGQISRGGCGREVSKSELADIMLSLEGRGAHNINFVTPTHYSPSVRMAVELARERGLNIPIVYNTGSYDTVDALRALDGTVDVYLPDFKYFKAATARKYCGAENYPSVAFAAIGEMVRQRPTPIIEKGLIISGVVTRVLLLPGHVAEAKLCVKKLYESFGNSIYISLMAQYTPLPGLPAPLDRRVTVSEYDELTAYAQRIGVVNGFVQELSSASEAYVPVFNMI